MFLKKIFRKKPIRTKLTVRGNSSFSSKSLQTPWLGGGNSVAVGGELLQQEGGGSTQLCRMLHPPLLGPTGLLCAKVVLLRRIGNQP